MRCSGRYTPGEGLKLTCTVDGDSTGEGITSVVYNANDQGLELGERYRHSQLINKSLPSFVSI